MLSASCALSSSASSAWKKKKKTIGDDIKEVYAELKGSGFDSKVVRTIIRLRKKEDHERQEEEAMLQLYMDALGMS